MTDFDVDSLLALPRLSSLRLSPDGRRLIVAVGGPDPEGKRMRSALWQVDPAGMAAPRRITRSAAGEAGGAEFLPDGSLLFTSSRPDPDAKPDPDRKVNALWLLPAGGGEARLLAAPEGGVDGLATARDAAVVAFGAGMFPGASDFAADAERGKARKDAGVGALLFENDYPVRNWDHWLGPRRRRLFTAILADDPEAPLPAPRDLEPDVAPSTFEETGFALSPDGRVLVAARTDATELPRVRTDLFAIDLATGERRTLTPGDGWYRLTGDLTRRQRGGCHPRIVREPGRGHDGDPCARRPGDRRAADARPGSRSLARGRDLGARRLGDLLHRRR